LRTPSEYGFDERARFSRRDGSGGRHEIRLSGGTTSGGPPDPTRAHRCRQDGTAKDAGSNDSLHVRSVAHRPRAATSDPGDLAGAHPSATAAPRAPIANVIPVASAARSQMCAPSFGSRAFG